MGTDEEAVRAAEATRYAAMVAGDAAALATLLDEDLAYSHSDGSRDTRATCRRCRTGISYTAGSKRL
jgi:hypothetical protein